MSKAVLSAEHSYFARMNQFMKIIYAPGLHLGFAFFWFLSLQGQMVYQGNGGPGILAGTRCWGRHPVPGDVLFAGR